VAGLNRPERTVIREPSVASLYASTPFAQDPSVLMIGERTNANGSKAFREAMIAEDWQKCRDIAKDQTRDGAHLLDLCVGYVGRDGVADMNALASRLATSSMLPIVLDSTETPVLKAGLEHLGGRCAINSVNHEDGDGPESRFHKTMELMVAEHGAGAACRPCAAAMHVPLRSRRWDGGKNRCRARHDHWWLRCRCPALRCPCEFDRRRRQGALHVPVAAVGRSAAVVAGRVGPVPLGVESVRGGLECRLPPIG